jgi:WD40 repeat protein
LNDVNPAVKVWDFVTGQELLVLRGPNNFATKAAFSHDRKRMASAGTDGPVQLYSLDIRDLLDLARSRVTTNLTPDDCQSYFQSQTCPPLP